MAEKRRNELLNIAEAIAAFLVVCIHFPVPGNGEVTALARISVPLFYSISGYFFYKGNADAERTSIPRKMKNLVVLLLISELTYLSFYTLLQMRHVGISFQAVKNVVEAEVLNYYCKELTERLAVFAPPFNGIGWFIGSLIMVYLVILTVIRRKWFHKFLLCALALLPVGVLMRRIFHLSVPHSGGSSSPGRSGQIASRCGAASVLSDCVSCARVCGIRSLWRADLSNQRCASESENS